MVVGQVSAGLALALLLLAVAVHTAATITTYRLQARETARLQLGYQRAHRLAQLNSSIISSFAMAIDAKDQHTQGHTERVRDTAVMIGKEMKLSEDEIEAVRMAAMLHDIGKLAVPDYILSKPAQLTQEEMRKVQTHTLVGAALLESVRFPWPVVPIIRSHHEWFDGTGYPDGLAGEQIPLGARILAVADVYDALLSHRPYRPAMSLDEATKFMRDRSGTQFDPRAINVCFQTLAKQSKHRAGLIFDAERGAAALPGESAEQSSIFMNIRQAHQELLALYEIVQTMGQSLDVQETMELVIGKTKRIIDFSTCVLFLCQQDEGYLMAAAAAGPRGDEIRGRRLQFGAGVSGVVAQTGTASGLGKSAMEDLSLLLGPEARSCGLVHVVSAPLTGDAAPIGTLTLYRPEGRQFTEDDARLAVAVARQAAIAINNARQHELTRQSAMTDQLTGLANARHFFMRLEQELSRARREHKPVSLVAVDLNGLKQVNDSYGHQQGDRVLRVIAEVFRRHVRDYDTVVRYAGDEFFIILPDTTNKTALETTHRIKETVRNTRVEMLSGREINLSASFGVATFPGDAEHADALIAVADQAMYADKRLTHQAALLTAQEHTRSGRQEELEADARQ
jgi:diguanylate cyclase (GGDEF)-like protein/putative nucleotidyltransferase with HDIG domain